MYGPLALLVVAVAVFAAGVVRWRVRRRPRSPATGGVDLEQVQGFVLVATLAVVPDLQVLEDGVGQLQARLPPLTIQQFHLHP